MTTDLPVIAERSKVQNTSKPTGRHTVLNTFYQISGIVRFVSSRRLSELRAGNAGMQDGDRIHLPENGDAVTEDRKVLSVENESRL